MNRPTLALDSRPDLNGQVLRRADVGCRAGTFRVITPRMRLDYAAATSGHPSLAGGTGRVGDRRSASRAIEVGFYRDLRGQVRHVQDEREEIARDADSLRAANNGLISISDAQRAFMEGRVDLLAHFDAVVAQRMNLPRQTPGY